MNSPMKYKDERKQNPLIAKPELFHAALDEFSQKSFHEASLNEILKAVHMNKGSLYHRFYDKTDLYLCMMEMIAVDKMEYMRDRIASPDASDDFFEQLKLFAIAGLEYAMHEKRYYSFWRNYLAESSELKNIVKSTFPNMGDDILEKLIEEAISSGQFSTAYSREFICKTISIFFYNIDALIDDNAEESGIISVVEQFTCFLKQGFV